MFFVDKKEAAFFPLPFVHPRLCTLFTAVDVGVSASVCVCLSDLSAAPSSASSFSTPYQKRERTLYARMYHSQSFQPSFLIVLSLLVTKVLHLMVTNTKISGTNCFVMLLFFFACKV